MQRLIVVALILLLSHTSVAFAAGPLLESAKRAAQQLGQTQAESPNAAQARRVATNLGVGRHVAVKLTSGRTLRGHLQAINDDHFVLLLDREARPIEIAYGEVQQLGPNLSRTAKTVLWTAVAVTVGMVIFAVAITTPDEESSPFLVETLHGS